MLAAGAASSIFSPQIAAATEVDAVAESPTITIHGTDTVYFTAGHTSAVPWKLPMVLSVHAAGEVLKGARIEIGWDARLASATSETVIVANDTEMSVVAATVKAGQLEFMWPSDMDATSKRTQYQCVLPIRRSDLFPFDSLDSVRTAGAVVHFRNSRAPLEVIAVPDAAAAQGLAWGASLSVLWGPQDPGTSASFPSVIRVESVGPAPIPAEAIVEIAVDVSKVASLQFVSVLANSDESKQLPALVESRTSAGVYSLRVTLPQALAAGSALRLNFEGAPSLMRSESMPATAVATFVAPPGTSAMQRHTGAETVALGNHRN